MSIAPAPVVMVVTSRENPFPVTRTVPVLPEGAVPELRVPTVIASRRFTVYPLFAAAKFPSLPWDQATSREPLFQFTAVVLQSPVAAVFQLSWACADAERAKSAARARKERRCLGEQKTGEVVMEMRKRDFPKTSSRPSRSYNQVNSQP